MLAGLNVTDTRSFLFLTPVAILEPLPLERLKVKLVIEGQSKLLRIIPNVLGKIISVFVKLRHFSLYHLCVHVCHSF